MDPSWATTWRPNEEVRAAAWVASKLCDTGVSHLAAVLAQQLVAAAGQHLQLTLALADTRMRLTARTERPMDQTAIATWQEQAVGLADRFAAASSRELWVELDNVTAEPGGVS